MEAKDTIKWLGERLEEQSRALQAVQGQLEEYRRSKHKEVETLFTAQLGRCMATLESHAEQVVVTEVAKLDIPQLSGSTQLKAKVERMLSSLKVGGGVTFGDYSFHSPADLKAFCTLNCIGWHLQAMRSRTCTVAR